jgi:hypothetical protein
LKKTKERFQEKKSKERFSEGNSLFWPATPSVSLSWDKTSPNSRKPFSVDFSFCLSIRLSVCLFFVFHGAIYFVM